MFAGAALAAVPREPGAGALQLAVDFAHLLIDPADYAQVLAELAAGQIERSTRFRLAKKVFAHCARR